VGPEEIVRAECDAWHRLDVDEIMSHFTSDAVWENVPFGPASGYEEIHEAVEGFLGRMTSADFDILHVAVAGNVVMTERIDHLVIDGHVLDARVMGVFETSGDKIIAWRDYIDMSKGHA